MKIQKLLWIVLDPERIRAPDSYMNAIGVQTKVETSIQQALQGIAELSPDGVILSVEILKGTSLQAAQLIEATYGTTVALLSETGSISDLPSDIQRAVIIAPASGPKVLMRLQTLIDRKTSNAPQTIRGTRAPLRKARMTGSALETGILLAIDNLSKGPFQIAKEGFSKLGRISAIGVKSSMGSGYLIANSPDASQEIDLAHLEIPPQLGLTNAEIQSQYLAQWDTEDHDVLEWAGVESLFWIPLESAQGKMNVIFVEASLASDHIRPSPVAKMSSIELATLPTNEEIPVELLLWLSMNQRLIPYVKAHTALLPEQKDRLLRNGIETLEVHKEDEVHLLQHLIRSDIERTLRQYTRAEPTAEAE
ncbi:MAG: hypothetical protein K2X47_19910 [Bdellovibrionales bacterium]|nr:hypothetical protein [Bdellovibrionales bacterium]